MAIFTLTEIDEQLSAYKAGLLKLATAQSTEIDVAGFHRKVTRADLPELRKTIEWLGAERASLDNSTGVSRINVMRVRR